MSMRAAVEGAVRSADGTTIAFERAGDGPPLILVDAAGQYRGFGPSRGLAALLAADFSVVTYDRRGRGRSSDTAPYAVEREVEDLAALVVATGGRADLYGMSSGACLALHAAAAGLPIGRLALFEPPISTDDAPAEDQSSGHLEELIAAGRHGDAVDYFQTAVGVPPEVLAQLSPEDRAALEAVAPTLLYDWVISAETSLEVVRAVSAPALVMDSQGSSDDLTGWAAAVVAALEQPTYRSIPGGWHGVSDHDLVAAITAFLGR